MTGDWGLGMSLFLLNFASMKAKTKELRVLQEKNETGFFKHCDNITYDYAD